MWPSSNQGGVEERMGEVLVVSVLGILVFGGLFLLLCPEWWSTSLGTLKEKQKGQEAKGSKLEE
jgi:hypothetical protein